MFWLLRVLAVNLSKASSSGVAFQIGADVLEDESAGCK